MDSCGFSRRKRGVTREVHPAPLQQPSHVLQAQGPGREQGDRDARVPRVGKAGTPVPVQAGVGEKTGIKRCKFMRRNSRSKSFSCQESRREERGAPLAISDDDGNADGLFQRPSISRSSSSLILSLSSAAFSKSIFFEAFSISFLKDFISPGSSDGGMYCSVFSAAIGTV